MFLCNVPCICVCQINKDYLLTYLTAATSHLAVYEVSGYFPARLT